MVEDRRSKGGECREQASVIGLPVLAIILVDDVRLLLFILAPAQWLFYRPERIVIFVFSGSNARLSQAHRSARPRATSRNQACGMRA
eukprot:6187965-Pleurochrysis_carterae.AAC.8